MSKQDWKRYDYVECRFEEHGKPFETIVLVVAAEDPLFEDDDAEDLGSWIIVGHNDDWNQVGDFTSTEWVEQRHPTLLYRELGQVASVVQDSYAPLEDAPTVSQLSEWFEDLQAQHEELHDRITKLEQLVSSIRGLVPLPTRPTPAVWTQPQSFPTWIVGGDCGCVPNKLCNNVACPRAVKVIN